LFHQVSKLRLTQAMDRTHNQHDFQPDAISKIRKSDITQFLSIGQVFPDTLRSGEP
jgi:hypothetical protein